MSDALTSWYQENRRPLPWRASQDPYRIWISEIMLQQTTVQAVIPYYERFLKSFPSVQALAAASLEEVLEHWSGLGYYSRARNLHKAAQLFAEKGFPKTAAELTEFPGLGPYTSRAVASIAFEEKVGVLDGNVIRILSRVAGLATEHWKPAGRQVLQVLADELAQVEKPSNLNQAMMELGATVCTNHNPTCLLCPWKSLCVSLKANTHLTLPLKKPRTQGEIWLWQPEIVMRKNRVALVQNPQMPFLKGQWVFPGKIKQLKKKPETFDLKHGITHHDIYIQIKLKKKDLLKGVQWCEVDALSSINPSILLKKVLSHLSS
ncbi:MAG: A/G-specific adenine glycosylase [Bdellovibrio sp.]